MRNYLAGHASKYLLLTVMVILLLIASGRSWSAESEQTMLSPEEERIVQRLKEELLKELRDGEFLQQQIEIGIRNFVRRQQEHQARAQQQQRDAAAKLVENIRPVSPQRDHIRGDPDALISLVEYSDFKCPYCKRFHLTAQRLVEAFGGKLNWVYRHFPLEFHNPDAQTQAEAAECANELGGAEAFWAFTDQIYARAGPGGFPSSGLSELAGELGMEVERFNECLQSGRYTARVQEDFKEGSSIGISGTPGNVLVNNRTGKTMLRSGARPFDTLKADIDSFLTVSE